MYKLKKRSSDSKNTQLTWWESDTAFVVKVNHVGGQYVGKESLRLLMKDGSCIKKDTLQDCVDEKVFIKEHGLDPKKFHLTDSMKGKAVYQFTSLVIDNMDMVQEEDGYRRRLVATLYVPLLGIMTKCEGPLAMKEEIIEDLWIKEFRHQFQGCTYHDPDDEMDSVTE